MKPGRGTRGAVFVEQLIAYLPVMFFFLATWQLIELFAAHLILQRAASAAARAAVVVLPDDPAFYAGTPPDTFGGERATDIKLAAAMILSSSPHFGDFTVEVTQGVTGHEPLTATVHADFHCFAGWVSLVCGAGGVRGLTAKSTYIYQGAPYKYGLTAPPKAPT
jgi:hypothetical protein